MCRKSGYFLHLPEREDNNSRNHKDYSKHHEHAISCLVPFGIVEYFCTLENKNRTYIYIFNTCPHTTNTPPKHFSSKVMTKYPIWSINVDAVRETGRGI